MRTFTWQGRTVEHIDDVDRWTSPELRAVERLAGADGFSSLTVTSALGLMVAVSIARATGQSVDDVDRQLTRGDISRIRDEINAAAAADATAAAAAEPPAAAAAPEPVREPVTHHFTGHMGIPLAITDQPGTGEILSPTSAGSEA